MKAESIKGHLAILGANVIWGLMAPASKAVLNSGQMSALTLTGLRIMGGALLFWLFSLILPQRIIPREKIDRRDWIPIFVASMLITFTNQLLVITGVSMTSPVDAAVMCSTTPLFTLLIAWLLLGDRPKIVRILGVALGFGGMLMFAFNSKSNATMHISHPFWGNLMCLISQVCAATYFVRFRGLTQRYSPFTLMKWLFLCSSIPMVALAGPGIVQTDWHAVSLDILLDAAYVVLFGTFVAYILMPIGQKALRPTAVAMYNYLQPVVALVFSILMGLGTLSFTTAMATLLIFLGVGIVNWNRK